MSKSRGNVVLPEEVVFGVYELADGYEFRDATGEVVDWREKGIWRDKLKTGNFFMATRWNRQPVFLCEKDDPRPCVLLLEGQEHVQHENLVMQ